MAFKVPFPGSTIQSTTGKFRTPFPSGYSVKKQVEYQPTPLTPSIKDVLTEMVRPIVENIIRQTTKPVEALPGILPSPKEEIQQAKEFIKQPIREIKEAGKAFIQAPKEAIRGLGMATEEVISSIEQKKSLTQVSANILNQFGVAGELLFSPISAVFGAAEKIPGLRQAAKVIALPFEFAGRIGAFASGEFIKALPISKESEDILKPAFERVGGLVSMIALGGAIVKSVSKGKKIDQKTIDTAIKEARTQEIKLRTELEKKPIDSATKRILFEKQVPSRMMEGVILPKPIEVPKVVPEAKLAPKIAPEVKIKPTEAILPEKGIIPLAKEQGYKITNISNTVLGKEKGFVYRIEKGKDKTYAKSETEIANLTKITQPIVPKELEPLEIVKPIEKPTGKVSKVALSIEAKAIEKGLTEGFKDLAEYDPITIREQSQKISNLMKTDIERAKRMATGKETLNKDIKGAALIKAIEDYAMIKSDGKLALELASSPLVSETSVAGQTLRFLRERNPDTATAKIQELKQVREKAIDKKIAGRTQERIKTEMKKNLERQLNKKTPWEKLIDELIC